MPIANAMCSIKDQMVLGDNAIKSFRIAKQASDYSDRINAIDFSPNGEHLISGEVSDQIIIYDCDSNKLIRTIPVRKYGVDLIRYTRSTDKFLHTSTKRDHTIRHMISFEHENKYLYYYDGHTERVVSLSVSPTDELFLSASLDRTVRLWDLRSNYCKGIMHLSDRPVVAFDPTGVVFAAGINSECFKLYDIRMFDKGPFVTFKLDAKTEKCFKWIDLKFSDDGKTIMVNTNGSTIRLIDAFNGKILQTINGKFRCVRNAIRKMLKYLK